MHRVEINEPVLTPEQGLLLGNGDLSVSVYQKADQIIWRFGKGDVWDRRHDLSEDPPPAHIDEVAHGIAVEGWTCGPYGGPVEAKNGTNNQERMREICQSCPPSYINKPYPCPKPVGELALHLPPDSMGLEIKQVLNIEEAKIIVKCNWNSGDALSIEAFIHPTKNVFCLHWSFDSANLPGSGIGYCSDCSNWGSIWQWPTIWFSLYRWADPAASIYNEQYLREYGTDASGVTCKDPALIPLPEPVVRVYDNMTLIEQSFYPDPIFLEGFKYQIAPMCLDMDCCKIDTPCVKSAYIRITPDKMKKEGNIFVGITTSSDPEAIKLLSEWNDMIRLESYSLFSLWETDNQTAADMFWSKSKVHIGELDLENVWYSVMHASRCIYRGGTVPPGLFFPSSLGDYSRWHGDYHTNYNFQQPFWGFLTANHPDLLDAYFEGIKFFLQIGKKIAHDYYNCRGAFVQLSGYPIYALDDPLGTVPMGRMAYMTGWVANLYWWRYLYTLDIDWLKTIGYPVIRDCALFYNDFLTIGEDGLYHAFPSNQGEEGFSGNYNDFIDRPQIMRHMWYCLGAAIQASQILCIDELLRVQWIDRLSKSAGDNGITVPRFTGLEKECYEKNPPEFGYGKPYLSDRDADINMSVDTQTFMKEFCSYVRDMHAEHFQCDMFRTYFGKYPYYLMTQIRSGDFIIQRDFPVLLQMIRLWKQPGGCLSAMTIAIYGRSGSWTESLGIIAPIQELMLQSWDGALRIFPCWPKTVDASFEKFRAEGAFLVTSSCKDGRVSNLEVISEKGAVCHMYSPWGKGINVMNNAHQLIEVFLDSYGRLGFNTEPGMTYIISENLN